MTQLVSMMKLDHIVHLQADILSSPIQYYIYFTQELSFDPWGYYKPRLVSEYRPTPDMPYFADYPMNDSQWNVGEIFPDNLGKDAPDVEELRTYNEKV